MRWLCVLVLAGCAAAPELPTCEKFTIHQVMTERGPLYVLNEDNLDKLNRVLHGLDERTCKAWRPNAG